ncbi:hypothetical protein FPV67DRAFT_1448783 [Lyophyllum atratum]|nr:hypothetical protein FPV67DRAFT_1448783 [Lyophyllum atratum]
MSRPTSSSSLSNSLQGRPTPSSSLHSQPPSRSTSRSKSKSHSRPITPITVSSQPQPHLPKPPRPRSQTRASSAIVTGTERLLALFDEEREKNDARHKAQLMDLEGRFQRFRAGAEEAQNKLMARVRELEMEAAAAKGKSAGSSNVLEGPADPAMLSQIDEESGRLLRQLALHLAQAAIEDTSGTTAQLEVPDAFIPAFAEYLTSHRKALHGWEEQCDAVEAERDVLREKNKMKRRRIRALEKKLFLVQPKGWGTQRRYVRPPDSGSEDGDEEGEGEGENENGIKTTAEDGMDEVKGHDEDKRQETDASMDVDKPYLESGSTEVEPKLLSSEPEIEKGGSHSDGVRLMQTPFPFSGTELMQMTMQGATPENVKAIRDWANSQAVISQEFNDWRGF